PPKPPPPPQIPTRKHLRTPEHQQQILYRAQHPEWLRAYQQPPYVPSDEERCVATALGRLPSVRIVQLVNVTAGCLPWLSLGAVRALRLQGTVFDVDLPDLLRNIAG